MAKIDKLEKSLFEALQSLESDAEYYAFFNDLCTPSELQAMKERWLVARFLHTTNLSYREIQQKTKVSLATITRIARFLNKEDYQGYKIALDRTHRHHH